MTILQYMSEVGRLFWSSLPVSLLVCLGEWAALLCFVGRCGRDLFSGRRCLLLHGALLACFVPLQLFHLQVVTHCLALLVLCSAYLCLLTGCDWYNAVFECSLFCLCLEPGKSLCRDGLLALGLSQLLPGLGELGLNLAMLGLYLAYLALLSALFRRRRVRGLNLPITAAQAFALLFPLFLYLAVRYFQYDQVERLDNAQWFRYDLLQYAVALCALTVIGVMESLLSSQAALAELTQRQLLAEQNQRQYELQRETIDFVNRRWHDMKHAITGIELMLAEEGGSSPERLRQAKAYLGDLRQGVDLYGDLPHTGRAELDVLLFQKARECRQRDIRLIPFIDASRTGFVSALDLSVLFGNAMDNAIEAVQALEDPAAREIRVKIGVSDGLLLMRFHNHYRDARRPEKGGFRSTKSRMGHGYGLSSISAIAERYGGAASAEARDGEFTLCVMLPVENSQL